MRLSTRRRAGIGLSAVLLVSPLAALAAAPASAEPAGTTGDGWAVTRAPGGYLVTVDLDSPLPMKSDAPTVVVDGETIGLATQSADGRSLSTFTTDAGVLDATSAEAGWASQAPASDGTPSRAVAVPEAGAAAADPLDEDPSAPGDFDWTESIYKFGDQAIPLAAIGGVRGELEGKVYLPTTGGARPTVILLHGRHTSCYTATPAPRPTRLAGPARPRPVRPTRRTTRAACRSRATPATTAPRVRWPAAATPSCRSPPTRSTPTTTSSRRTRARRRAASCCSTP